MPLGLQINPRSALRFASGKPRCFMTLRPLSVVRRFDPLSATGLPDDCPPRVTYNKNKETE